MNGQEPNNRTLLRIRIIQLNQLTELILAVFFSYQYSNAIYQKYEMIIFHFLLLKRHRTSLEIRDTKTNYHNHFKLFISHGK